MEQVPHDLIDLETAREETGETWARLRSWIKAGKIKAWKRGHYLVISRAEVKDFAERINAVRPVSPPPEGASSDQLSQSK